MCGPARLYHATGDRLVLLEGVMAGPAEVFDIRQGVASCLPGGQFTASRGLDSGKGNPEGSLMLKIPLDFECYRRKHRLTNWTGGTDALIFQSGK